MTGIDGYDWASVGWSNPVPGDADVVRQIGGQLSDLASEASLQNQLLQSVGDAAGSIWSGPAANTFHPTMKKLPGQLDQLINSYNDAAYAVNAFWPKQQAAQQLAVRALAKAQAAQAAMTAAQAQVSSAQTASQSAASAYNQSVNPPPGTPPPATAAAKAANLTRTTNLAMEYRTAQSQLGSAQSALTAARGDMAAAVSMRDQATSDFTAAAGGFVTLMRDASRAGIQNVHHGWLSSLGSAIAGGVESAFHAGEQLYHEAVHLTDAGIDQLGSIAVAVGNYEYHQIDAGWHDFTQAMATALPVLKVIDTVLSDASLVVGVLALVVAPIPGLDAVVDPALEGLNEVLMVAKTGDDLLELAGGDDEAEAELVGDGIGMATLGLAGGLATDGASDAAKVGEETTAEATSAATADGAAPVAEAGAVAAGDGAAPVAEAGAVAAGDGAAPVAEAGAVAAGDGVAPVAEAGAVAAGDGVAPVAEAGAVAAGDGVAPVAEAGAVAAGDGAAPVAEAGAVAAGDGVAPVAEAGAVAAGDGAAPVAEAGAVAAGDGVAPVAEASATAAGDGAAAVAEAPASTATADGAGPATDAASGAGSGESGVSAGSGEPAGEPVARPSGDGAAGEGQPAGSSGDGAPAAHAGAASGAPAEDAPKVASTLSKVVGKENIKKMVDFSGMKAGLTTAKDSVQEAGIKDLPKTYVKWAKAAYHSEVGETVGADGKVISTAKDGLAPLRKVLYVRDRIETVNDGVNLGDKMINGHGNFLQRQEDGKDWETQAWDKATGRDGEPPIWVAERLDELGVGG